VSELENKKKPIDGDVIFKISVMSSMTLNLSLSPYLYPFSIAG